MAAASLSGCAGQGSEELAPDPVAIAELGIEPRTVTCMAVDDEALADPSSAPAPAAGSPAACPPGYELHDSDGAIDTNQASTDFGINAPAPSCLSCAALRDGARVICAKQRKTVCPGAQCTSRCGSTETFRTISFSCC